MISDCCDPLLCLNHVWYSKHLCGLLAFCLRLKGTKTGTKVHILHVRCLGVFYYAEKQEHEAGDGGGCCG